MWYTNIYSNIIVYQKYIGTSIDVGCGTHSLYASSGPKPEAVPTYKLLRQGYVMECLKSSLKKFNGRYGDLIKQYEVSFFKMLHEILGHNHIQ